MRPVSWTFQASSRSSTSWPIPPGVGGALSTCRSRSRNYPELLQEAQLVEVVPLLRDPTVGDAVDGDPGYRHLPAGRRDTHELTLVGAAVRPAVSYPVAFGDQILHGGTPVGEGAEVYVYEVLDVFGATLH